MLVVAGDRNNHAAHRANLRIRSLRVHKFVCPDVKHDLKMAASIAALVGGWNVAPRSLFQRKQSTRKPRRLLARPFLRMWTRPSSWFTTRS